MLGKNNLRAIRKARGLSQTQLSMFSRVHQPDISRIESGRIKPWPAAMIRLANVLGAELSDIFPEIKK